MNEEFIYDYNQEAVIRKTENSIREEGYEKGILVGSKETKIEIAKSMLEDNISFDNISKYTGLSIDNLNLLSKDIKS